MSGLLSLYRLRKKSSTVHPDLLPTKSFFILSSSILQFMTFKDLLSLRLVNKQWNKNCIKLLQGRVTVNLKSWDDFDNFVKIFNSSKSQKKLFKSLKLDSTFLPQDRNLIETFGKIGYLITSLQICCNCNAKQWKQILFQIFENLQELKISGAIPTESIVNYGRNSILKILPHLKSILFHTTNKRSEQLYVKKFTKDLLSLTPNLMSIAWGSGNNYTEILPCLILQNLFRNTNINNITELNCLPFALGLRDLNNLAVRNYPLKKLTMSIAVDVPSYFLGDFLEFHGETLKYLHLAFGPANPISIKLSPNPKLTNVVSLTLQDYRRSIKFIQHMKALRGLVLLNSDIERAFYADWDEAQKQILPKLEYFEVYSESWVKFQKFPIAALIKLAYYFPKMKRLRLQALDDKGLRRVFRNFQYLVELQAPDGIYSDDAFKSLSVSAKVEDQEQDNGQGGCARSSRYTLYSFTMANITSLRRLELDSVFMKDEFILEGIIKWKNLKHLSLKNCRIRCSTLTRLLMEMDLNYLKMEVCEVFSDKDVVDRLPMNFSNECIEMAYGDIERWRMSIMQLLLIK